MAAREKKPWCGEGVCRPAVPMHVKGCARRAEHIAQQDKMDAVIYDQKAWIPKSPSEKMARLEKEMDVAPVDAEPGSGHYSWAYLPLVDETVPVQGAVKVCEPIPCGLAEDPYLKEQKIKKSLWKRVFGG